MSEQERPPRLIDDPELGKSLRAVRDEGMSPDRLAANAKSLDAKLTQLPPQATFPFGTSALTLAAVAALFGIAAFVVAPMLYPEMPAPTPTPTPLAIATPVATATPPMATATPALAATPVPGATAISTPSTIATAVSVVATPAPTPAPRSSLAEELRLFEQARTLQKDGQHAKAREILADIERRFPDTSLRPEIDVTIAETWVADEQYAEAAAALSALVSDPAHTGRRAELLRTLGDVERARGNCNEAVKRYREALSAGASGEEASAARRGLGACQATYP